MLLCTNYSCLVPSDTTQGLLYFVDISLRYCSCPEGKTRGPCKHKFLISEVFGISNFDMIPTSNPEIREKCMYLGTGKHLDNDWFLPLQSSKSVETIEGNSKTDRPTENISETSPSDPNKEIEEENSGIVQGIVQFSTEDNEDDRQEHADLEGMVDKVIDKLGERLKSRLHFDEDGYRKAIKVFEKTIDSLPKTFDSKLQKALYSFGKADTQVRYICVEC